MKKSIIAVAFAFLSLVAIRADAEVQYPIDELGGCVSEAACRAYCDNMENVGICLSFAEKNGMMSPEEIVEARKFAEIGQGPGGCTSKASCESYCNDVGNIRECTSFAEKNGFMSGKELEEAKRIVQALDSGASMPGGCTSKDSCESYCENDANVLECVTFAEAAGFISAEEASIVRKTGGKGPGGCRREECESFCQNPDNQEVCYNFAKENGLMSKEMEEGSQSFLESLKNAPAGVRSCMESAFGDLNKVFPGQRTGAKLQECFEAYGREHPNEAFWPAQGGPDGQRGEPQEPQRPGPGGCTNREECEAYCRNNPDECMGFGPGPSGQGQTPSGVPSSTGLEGQFMAPPEPDRQMMPQPDGQMMAPSVPTSGQPAPEGQSMPAPSSETAPVQAPAQETAPVPDNSSSEAQTTSMFFQEYSIINAVAAAAISFFQWGY